MTDEKTTKLVRHAAAKLTFHGVERILERSKRAPSWLAEVLNHGQFAHLGFSLGKQKRYALVFDILSDTYLVPIIPAKTRTVITVLTQAQYESNHGAIPPVLFQLAQLARKKALEPEDEGADGELTPQKRLAKKQARLWNANWRVILAVQTSERSTEKRRVYIDSRWRQDCISAEFERNRRPRRLHKVAAELTFETQAILLGQSVDFLGWIVKKLEAMGEDLESLVSVSVMDNHQHKKVNLVKHLVATIEREERESRERNKPAEPPAETTP